MNLYFCVRMFKKVKVNDIPMMAPRALRISRGYSPMNIRLNINIKHKSLAFGAMQKCSLAFGHGRRVALSSYLGDLFSPSNLANYTKEMEFMLKLYGSPEILALDAHPHYANRYIALNLAQNHNCEVMEVFHHHAHLNALLLEADMSEALGIIFDGSGYGSDGSIWGGEFLLGNLSSFERALHFKPFRILGSEKSIRDGRRLLLGYALSNDLTEIVKYLESIYDRDKFTMLSAMSKGAINAPLTSSVGRLFDIVAFILGLKECSYAEQSGEYISMLSQRALESSFIQGFYDVSLEFDDSLSNVKIQKDSKVTPPPSLAGEGEVALLEKDESINLHLNVEENKHCHVERNTSRHVERSETSLQNKTLESTQNPESKKPQNPDSQNKDFLAQNDTTHQHNTNNKIHTKHKTTNTNKTAFNPYPFIIENNQINIAPCILEIFRDSMRGVDRNIIALRFIDTLAFCIKDGVERLSAEEALFGGGVFGNYTLCNRAAALLKEHSIRYFFPQMPCNDYAIALGQIGRVSVM